MRSNIRGTKTSSATGIIMISGVVVYSGSWQYPDDTFAEAVVIQAA
jgi:hypothetical protein